MKKYIISLFIILLFLGCSGDSPSNNNPYIPNYSFSAVINMNLPLYSGLNTAINPIIITEQTGITIIVMKISDTDFRAWNSSCPNQSPVACSQMGIHGLYAKCSCDELEYSLFTGVGTAAYAMIPFRVEIMGNNMIKIYN